MDVSGTSEFGDARGEASACRITLYIAGDTDLSRRAEANLRRIMEEIPPRRFILDVIDVVINPSSATSASRSPTVTGSASRRS